MRKRACVKRLSRKNIRKYNKKKTRWRENFSVCLGNRVCMYSVKIYSAKKKQRREERQRHSFNNKQLDRMAYATRILSSHSTLSFPNQPTMNFTLLVQIQLYAAHHCSVRSNQNQIHTLCSARIHSMCSMANHLFATNNSDYNIYNGMMYRCCYLVQKHRKIDARAREANRQRKRGKERERERREKDGAQMYRVNDRTEKKYKLIHISFDHIEETKISVCTQYQLDPLSQDDDGDDNGDYLLETNCCIIILIQLRMDDFIRPKKDWIILK